MLANLFQRTTVQNINPHSEDGGIQLVTFRGKLREQLVEQFQQQYAVAGHHVESGGKASPATILGALSAIGATSLGAGKLFMATAPKGDLMILFYIAFPYLIS